MKRLLLTSLLLSGCNWVTQSNYENRLQELDDDGDGFTRDGDGDPALIDCDDTDPDINPDADDTWYDGVDSDSAGDDDFDQDKDGQRSQAHTEDGEDCDDTDDTIYVDADDTWYDGVDSDCAGDDDFDQDKDGYRSAIESGDGDDCLDTNPEANPGALENLADTSIDHDCDGAGDSIAMWWDSALAWEDIGSIHLGETTDRVYLSIIAERFTDSSNTTYYDIGVAPYWSKAETSPNGTTTLELPLERDIPGGVEFWSSTDLVETTGRFVTTGHAIRFEDDRIYGVTGIIDTDPSVNRTVRLYRNILSTSEQESVAVGTGGISSDLVDIGFLKDNSGNYHVVGCDPTSTGTFQYVLTNDAHLDDNLNGNFLHTQNFLGLARPYGCVAGKQANSSSPQLWFADNNNASNQSYATLNENATDSSSISISVTQSFSGTTVEDIDHLVTTTSESWVVMSDSAINQISLRKNLNEFSPLSTGSNAPMAIDLAEDATNNRMWIAWTDEIFGAHIAWADSTGFIASAVLNTSIQAEDIAILVPEGGEQAVVIVAGDSQVEMALIKLP